jgi:hypothetical protein
MGDLNGRKIDITYDLIELQRLCDDDDKDKAIKLLSEKPYLLDEISEHTVHIEPKEVYKILASVIKFFALKKTRGRPKAQGLTKSRVRDLIFADAFYIKSLLGEQNFTQLTELSNLTTSKNLKLPKAGCENIAVYRFYLLLENPSKFSQLLETPKYSSGLTEYGLKNYPSRVFDKKASEEYEWALAAGNKMLKYHELPKTLSEFEQELNNKDFTTWLLNNPI